ncbi:MAG: hypothetical protein ACI841_003816, partial [Planctomycetota bacterium]
ALQLGRCARAMSGYAVPGNEVNSAEPGLLLPHARPSKQSWGNEIEWSRPLR